MRKLRNQNAEERMISIETPLLQFTEDELFPDPIDDSPSVIPGHACEHVISSSSSSPSTKPNPEPELEPEIITSREPNPNSNLNVPSDECEHVNAVLEWELHNGQQVKFSLECVPNPNCEDLIKSGSREQHESPNSVPEGKDFLLKPLIEIDGVSYYPQGSKSHFNEMPNHDHNPQIQPNLSHELDLPPPLEDDVNNDQQQQQQQGSPDVTLEEDFEDQESALHSEYCMRKKRNLMYISPSNSDEDDEPIPRFLSIEKSHKPHRITEQSANYYSPEVRRRRGANGNHTPAEMAAHVAVGGEEEDPKKRQECNNSFHAFEHHGETVKNGVQSQEDSVMSGRSEKLDMICYNKQQEPINPNIDSEAPPIGAAEEGREEAQIHQGAHKEILVPSDDTNSDSIPTKNSQVETTHRPLYPYESDSDEEKEEEEGQTPWYYTFEVSEKRAGELESETHIVTEIKSDNENIGRVKNSSSDKLGTPPQPNEQPCDHCAVEKEKLGETDDGEIRPRLPPIEQSADEEDFFAQLEFHLLSQMNDELGYGDWPKEFCSATSEDHDVSQQLASFSAHRNSVWEEKEVILVPTVLMVPPHNF